MSKIVLNMNKFLCVVSFVLSCFILMAQTSDDALRHHIIVTVDMAGCNDWNSNQEVARTISNLLDYTNYDYSNNRSLFIDNDYISFLGFRTDVSQQSMTTYQKPLLFNNTPAVYRNSSKDRLKKFILENWSNMVQSRVSDNDKYYSLVSVAKPYALNALRNDTVRVNRTFLIMVTDHHYNGNDFYDEIKFLNEKQIDNSSYNINMSRDKIFELCYAVEQEYFIKYLRTSPLPINNYHRFGYVELYEYVPLQRSLSLSAILNYPPVLTATRCRGNKYKVVIPVVERDKSHYRLERLDVFPYTGKRYHSPQNASTRINAAGDTLVIEVSRDERPDSMCIRAWVNLRDSVYNATVLSPSIIATEYMGRDGLNVNIPINYEPDAGLFGCRCFPLQDRYWIFDISQWWMAAIYTVIISAIFFTVAILLFRKYHPYNVKIEDITMK